MKKLLFFIFIFISIFGYSQKDWELEKGQYIITDTLKSIALDPVVILKKLKFNSNYDRRYYLWYKKKTYKAYPYAIKVQQKLDTIDSELLKITSKRKRRKFIKKRQKFLEETFTEEIKDLTRTEGRILFKLIYRQTGKTLNEHIKDKRGKFKAFLYRSTAKFFKLDLKSEYHPDVDIKDYMVENILQRAFINGDLEEFKDVIGIDLLNLPEMEIKIEKK